VFGAMAAIAGLISWFGLMDSSARDARIAPIAGVAIVGVVLLGAGPLLAFYTRDWLLIRRIRFILRARGRCAACGYVLVGLPVTSASQVKCPECAFESDVDASLNELATDATGAVRYQPDPEVIRRGEPWWTAARRRRALRWTASVLAL